MYLTDLHRINIPYCGQFEMRTEHDHTCARRIIELIEGCEDVFSRNPKPGHITASSVVVSEDFEALLMTHHARLNRWLQLGGHCDGIKDPYFVAKKEAYEESGLSQIWSLTAEILDLDIHVIPSSARDPEHIHYDVRYIFQADKQERLQASRESNQLRWVPLTDLEKFTDDISIIRLKAAIFRIAS